MSFKGYDTLRSAGEKIEYTPEQLEELIRCERDIIYFANKYFFIKSIDLGETLIPLREYQKRMLKAMIDNRKCVLLCPRQSAKTTTTSIFILHFILFNNAKNVAVLANKQDTAIEVMDRIQFAYIRLPYWLQQGVQEFTKTQIRLENESKVKAAATSKSAISGLSIALLYVDEVAKIEDHVCQDFFDSVLPVVESSKTGRIILSSTPLGLNYFYTVWKKAVTKQSDYFPIRVHWWEVPDKDEKWKAKIIRSEGPRYFNQEFGCLAAETGIGIGVQEVDDIKPIENIKTMEELFQVL